MIKFQISDPDKSRRSVKGSADRSAAQDRSGRQREK